MTVIDMWAPILPTREVMAYVSDHFPQQMAGYLRVFFKRPPRAEEFRQIAAGFSQVARGGVTPTHR